MSDMKIKFSVHQNPLKDEQGRTTYQVRQDTLGAIDTKGLVLVVEKQANAYIYRLNPNLTRP